MLSRTTAVLVALLAAGPVSAGADDGKVVWTHLDVDGHLENDGGFHVRETHEVAVSGDGFSTIRYEMGRDTDQVVQVTSLERIAADGSRVPLTPGDLGTADHYQLSPWALEWSLKDKAAPPLAADLTYEIRYDLANALAPAWSVGPGPLPLEREGGMIHPLERWPWLLAGWREAWPELTKRYRLDHDVLFPSYGLRNRELRGLDYHLRYDDAWRLVTPGQEWAKATADVQYRVRATLEYLGAGRPPAASFRSSAIRAGSLVAYPLVGAFLWICAFVLAPAGRRSVAALDRSWVQEHLLRYAPEVVRAHVKGDASAPSVEAFFTRLAMERKVQVQVTKPATDDENAEASMRLRVPRDSFAPYEREVVDAVFPAGEETSTSLVQSHYKEKGFEPDEVLSDAFARAAPAQTKPPWRPIASTLALLGFAGGVALLFRDTAEGGRAPVALGVGLVVNSFVLALMPKSLTRRSWPVAFVLLFPLVALTAVMVGLRLAQNPSPGLDAAIGLTLLSLGCYQSMLNSARPSFRGEAGRRSAGFAQAKAFAAAELRKESPALEDGWIPHLEALGLARDLESWRRRFAEGSGGMVSGPFTGRAPAPPALPEDWSNGFFVYADEED